MTPTITGNLSLLDYIKNYENGVNDMAALSTPPGSAQQQALQDVESSLVSLNSIDDLVDKIQSGESNASPQTIADMLDFYQQQVSSEVDDLAQGLDLSTLPDLAYTNGEWQYLSASAGGNTKAEQRFVDYLNKDNRLGDRMKKLLSLTQLNEITTAKEYAAQLNQNDTDINISKEYLLSTRQQITDHNVFIYQNNKLYPAAKGLAYSEFNAYQKAN